ncbi:hypothetical protein PsYK624_049240 [Phanerochaete sordida]|uniref:Uncharacterized protein n=1 Tax=Phanerochaete sordida TaxID=48140 RepID=A0A9P3G479_9APHY|nr:hypothetical protein PsYK624_049240 [Phanerochaete sordida]
MSSAGGSQGRQSTHDYLAISHNTDVVADDEHDAVTRTTTASKQYLSSQRGILHGAYRRPSLTTWLPAVGITLGTFGIVAILLGWLLTRRVHDHLPNENSQFRGALVALENPSSSLDKNADGTVNLSGTLWALTVTTIATRLVGFTAPIIIGVFALRIAAVWIRAQEDGRVDALPTSTQYGLLVIMCSFPSIASLSYFGKYLGTKRGGARVVPMLSLVVAAVFTTIVLSNLLCIVDIWLHSTSRVFIHTEISDIAPSSLPALGAQIDLSICPGPALVDTKGLGANHNTNYTNCAHIGIPGVHGVDQTWGNATLWSAGQETVSEQGPAFRSVIVDKYAVMVSADPPSSLANVTFETFGISAECLPVADCTSSGGGYVCPKFQPPVWLNFTGESSFSVQPFNLSGNIIANDGENHVESWYGYPMNAALNPYGALVSFGFGPTAAGDTYIGSGPGWYTRSEDGFDSAYYLSACTVTAYNMTLLYSSSRSENDPPEGTYTLASDPELSNFNTTSALFAALDVTLSLSLAEYLQTALAPAFVAPSDAFNIYISEKMSYAMVALASPLFEARYALAGKTLAQVVASRYPLVPLGMYAALLCAYGVVVLVLGASAALVSSRAVAAPPNSATCQGTARTQAELVQLRLTEPLAAIAEQLAGAEGKGVALDASGVDMFREQEGGGRVAFHFDEPGAGGRGGLIRRLQTVSAEEPEK